MPQSNDGEGGRPGLFVALKNLLANLLAIGRTRAELLVVELEEEKFRLLGLLGRAVGAAFLLGLAVVLGLFWLLLAFWEQRLLIVGLAALACLGGGFWLLGALRRAAAAPSRLFAASLAELDEDIAQLRGRSE